MVPIWSCRKRRAWQHMLASSSPLCLCWRDSWAQSSDTNPPWAAPAAPQPIPWVPILTSGIFPVLTTEGRVRPGGKGRILSFAKCSFIWDSAQEGISVGGFVVETRLQNVMLAQHLQAPACCPLWLPPQPGYAGVAFTAQKSHVGLCDQNTSCHLPWAPVPELLSCSRKGEEPKAVCEDNVRSGQGPWAEDEAVTNTGSGSWWAGRTTDGMKIHSPLIFLQGDHTDGKQAKIFQSLRAWAKSYYISMIQEARIFCLFQSQCLLQLWKGPTFASEGTFEPWRDKAPTARRGISPPPQPRQWKPWQWAMQPLAHLLFHMQGNASPRNWNHHQAFNFLHRVDITLLGSLPHVLKFCVLFSVKYVPCGSTCCSGGGSGIGMQARASPRPADACAVGGTLVWLTKTLPWPLFAITLQLEVQPFGRDIKQRFGQIAIIKNATFPATVGVLPPELQPAFNSSNLHVVYLEFSWRFQPDKAI